MQHSAITVNWILTNTNLVFESIGILAFAVSGILESARKKLDLAGMILVTGFTSFGGGTLRDIILDRRPFYWVQNQVWIYAIIGMCLLSLVFLRKRHLALTERAVIWPDAIGLGIFSAGGTQIALAAGQSPIVSVILGTLTPIVGGIIRDIAVSEIPKVFTNHQPYSVIGFAGSWVVVLGDALNWPTYASLWLAAGLIIAVRLISVYRGWKLPTWRL